MKAGTYYVGDLCYVLSERWGEVCSLIIKDGMCLNGEFELKDGTQFAIQGTAHGDGEYLDQKGNSYPVDSGTIGCVLLSEIDNGAESEAMRLGTIIEFDEDFKTSYEDGTIVFGEVRIETDSTFDWDEEEEWDEE